VRHFEIMQLDVGNVNISDQLSSGALYLVDFLKVLSNNSSLACWFRRRSREINKSRIKERSTCGKSNYLGTSLRTGTPSVTNSKEFEQEPNQEQTINTRRNLSTPGWLKPPGM